MLVTRVVDRLEAPPLAQRQATIDGPVTQQAYYSAFVDMAALHAVEVLPPPRPAAPSCPARVVFWNAERLKYFTPSVALLESCKADALLLCEVDVGMARTGNRHTIRDLAAELGAGHVFGAEFVELGLGDLREQRAHAGETNRDGLHGAGFVSRATLTRPALVRLETSGRWFDGAFDERRVGGRIAMLAEMVLGDTRVLLASAHYESHTDPAGRLAQTRTLLDAIDAHAPDLPVLIGGDFNTNSFSRADWTTPAVVAAAVAVEPNRLKAPMLHEPMFGLLRERGYDWDGCNVPEATTERTRPDGTPSPPFAKIDWLFARGLRCRDPQVIPAVDADGVAISDHEALAVTIEPA